MDAAAVAHYNAQRVEVVNANSITGSQILLQMLHRLLALVILGAVAFAAWSARRALGSRDGVSRLALVWLGLVVTQGLLGAATIWSNKAADVATAHVLTGALLLALGVLLTLITFRELTWRRSGAAILGGLGGGLAERMPGSLAPRSSALTSPGLGLSALANIARSGLSDRVAPPRKS
jgi:hypothetical protein